MNKMSNCKIIGINGPPGDQGFTGIQGDQGLEGDQGISALFPNTQFIRLTNTSPTGKLGGEAAIPFNSNGIPSNPELANGITVAGTPSTSLIFSTAGIYDVCFAIPMTCTKKFSIQIYVDGLPRGSTLDALPMITIPKLVTLHQLVRVDELGVLTFNIVGPGVLTIEPIVNGIASILVIDIYRISLF